MIRKHIHAGTGCARQVRCKRGLTGGAGTEDHHLGSRSLYEGTEDFEIAAVRGCIISHRPPCGRALDRDLAPCFMSETS
jgi:hypothetical protein